MSSASQKARWQRVQRTMKNLADLEKLRFAAKEHDRKIEKAKAEKEKADQEQQKPTEEE